MGSVRQIREHSGYIMKNTLVFVFGLLIIVSMFSTSNGQKGGAKAGMRGRGRGGSGGGGTDAFGNGSGRRACVGLCYLRKLQGKPPLPEPKERKPCIGMCYLKKLRGQVYNCPAFFSKST